MSDVLYAVLNQNFLLNIKNFKGRVIVSETIKTVVKRTSEEVPYDPEKIKKAIAKAFNAGFKKEGVEKANLDALTMNVQNKLIARGLTRPNIEDIQDIVEETLMESGYVSTAKSYVLYRAERTRVRDSRSRLMKVYEEITFNDAKYNEIKRENANVNGDTAMGTMLKYGSEGAKEFYHDFLIKPEFSEAHRNGDIHIHDLDFYAMTTTCTQIDLLRLFKGGFSTGHGVLREPNDIQSYAALACIAIQSNQNDQHGGQSIVSFDYGLAPGVIKTFNHCYCRNIQKGLELTTSDDVSEETIKQIAEKLKEDGKQLRLSEYADYQSAETILLRKQYPDLSNEEIERVQKWSLKQSIKETDRATYQAMEALIHNLNTMHSRAGAQTPFSSINYGMDTSPEGRMVIKNVLLAHEAGLGGGETPIFPIHCFRVKEGINVKEGEPNYDLFKLACRVSAKRLFPNFVFQDAPFNLKYYKPGHPETEIAAMGCRTRVLANVYDPSNEICARRGNLSFTSINLPRIAIRAKGDLNWFYTELQKKLELVVDQLLERFEIQCSRKVKNFPFLMGEGVWLDSEKLGPEDEVREVLKHGTLSIGFIGLAETLVALIGKHHGQSAEAQKLGLEIIGFMRKFTDEQAQRRHLNFSLLATPAEGLSGRFVEKDKILFGTLPGITDRDYYTNSFHIPVYFPISIVEKIRLEAPYHALTNAGHITYVELDGDTTENLEAFEKIVHLMRKSGIGYGAINHPIDHDPACGYNGIIRDRCPKCGREEDADHPFQRIRRITGYLVGTLDRFNDAKRKEVEERVQHRWQNED